MKKILIIYLFATTILCAQNFTAKVDSIAKTHFKDTSMSGLAIGIVHNQKSETFYFGGKYTNLSKDIDSLSLFEIGSITKVYTGFILESLEQDGMLNKQDLIAKYLPQEISKNKEWASKVRLIDLITHSSGMPSYDNTKSLSSFKNYNEDDPFGIFNKEFILSLLNKIDLIPDYGKISYSNFGIGVLGIVLENASGESFNELLRRYLTDRMELKNTYLKLEEAHFTNFAIPHSGKEVRPIINLAAMKPAGSIKSSLPDLLTFVNFHLNPPDEYQSLVNNVLKSALKTDDAEVGMGWGIFEINGISLRGHNGGTYGSSSIVIIAPSQHLGVVVLSNNQNGNATKYGISLIQELVKGSR